MVTYAPIFTLQELEYNIKTLSVQADNELAEGLPGQIILKEVSANDQENKEKKEETNRKLYLTQFNKAMHTLKVVLNLLNMQFFMERLELRYEGVQPTAEHVVLLCNRCLKFYNAIEHLGLIFKLL